MRKVMRGLPAWTPGPSLGRRGGRWRGERVGMSLRILHISPENTRETGMSESVYVFTSASWAARWAPGCASLWHPPAHTGETCEDQYTLIKDYYI